MSSSSPRIRPSRLASMLRLSPLGSGRGAHVERGTRVDRNVRLRGRNIYIGAQSEILQGSTIETLSMPGERISIGSYARVKAYTWICSYSGHIKFGESALIGHGCVLFGHGGIEIGHRCMLSQYVSIVSSNHAYWMSGTLDVRGFTREPIIIGDDVWIGANSVITGGAVIENNVVVGAGSVVRGRLTEGFLYAGTPALPLKRLSEGGSRDVQVFHW